MVRDTARDYAQEKLFPRVLKAYRDENYDPAIIREMGELGLLGSTIPEEYGGAGLGYVAYGLIAREIERVDSGFRSAMSVQSSLVMHPIYAYGTEAQRRKYLPKLATGEFDRLLRPDRARSRLRSRLDGDPRRESRRRLSASPAPKRGSPTRRSPTSRVVWAKLDGKIRGFIVERGTKGFSTPKIEGKLSLRASITGEIVLDGAVVPEENLLPNVSGPRRSVRLPQHRALRHRLGRDRRRGVLLASRPRLCARPQAVRPAARRQSADPEEARRHADRDHARPARARCAWRGMIDAGQGGTAGDLAAQAQQLRQGARHRPAGARHARRQRHLRRIPRHARALQPRDRQHLRRHPRHPRADPRPRADRHPGVHVRKASGE